MRRGRKSHPAQNGAVAIRHRRRPEIGRESVALRPRCDIDVEMLRRPVRRLKKNLEQGFVRVRGALVGDVLKTGTRKGGVITLPRPGSDQLFFVYTGKARRLGLDPRAFFKKTRLFERNVAFLRDERGPTSSFWAPCTPGRRRVFSRYRRHGSILRDSQLVCRTRWHVFSRASWFQIEPTF
jgi:hypothetical protein